MLFGARAFVIGVALLHLGAPANARSGQPASCTDWRECRQLVESALDSGNVEQALDLAWRTVQRGPKDDPDLMFLLARAQSRSGRPHDALVMVRRLAERGVRTGADTHPDLERTRALPAWAETEALLARVNAGEPSVTPATGAGAAARTGKPAATPAPAPAAGKASTAAGTAPAASDSVAIKSAPESSLVAGEALRFNAEPFVVAGLAYDAVSHRFVYGDRDGRKLRVVGVGLDHAVDLVRAESAGFFNVRALEIDVKRGDLWVVSGNESGTAGALHQLQLVSGRPLQVVPIEGALLPLRPVDLAVTDAGAVIVLDRDGRLIRLRPGRTTPELLLASKLDDAASVATSGEGTVFVASRAGIARIDLATKAVTALSPPAQTSFEKFERLRAHRGDLVGLQADAEGTRRIVRLQLTPNGRRIRQVTRYDTHFGAAAGTLALAVSGDEISVMTGGPDASGSAKNVSAAGPPAELIVHRLRLR